MMKPFCHLDTVIRELESSDSRAFSSLLDRCFGLKTECHYLDDFPIWSLGTSLKNRRFLRLGAFIHNKLIGSACGMIARLKIADETILPITLVGAVGVDVSYQGKGIASELVKKLDDWSTLQNSSLSVLWSSSGGLYKRLGYDTFGVQFRIPLNVFAKAILHRSCKRPNPDQSRIKLDQEWDLRLMPKLMHRTEGLVVLEEDEEWLRKHKNVSWNWLERAGQIEAYCACGRGIDLNQVIHEWGGNLQDLLHLMEAMSEANSGIWVLTPLAFLRSFDISPTTSNIITEPLGWGKFIKTQNHNTPNIMGGEFANQVWIWGLDAV